MSQIETNSKQVEQDKAELKLAWDDLIENIQKARDVIDHPELFGPTPTSRVLAEGYRYLSGFLHHAIERTFHEDANFPAFRNALSIFNKSTIDNSDAIYFYAPIDGSKRYLIKGKAESFKHWRGDARATSGKIAPQYLMFETSDGPMSGDTGELSELAPGFRTGFGSIDSSELLVEANGGFELLLAPEKPQGFTGNFICTHKPPNSHNPKGGERYATYINGRQLFYDWENEEAIHLDITCLDTEGDHPPALTPQSTAAHLRRMGSIINGQMKFWMEFYDVALNANGAHDFTDDKIYFMPVNGYNKPNAASGATGGGMSTNIYAGGIYELEENEALYIEATYTGDPVYVSVHLGNMWGESPDYANHQSSLNLHQMHMGKDGVQRWVVAHKDPGVQNWLDTTGLPKGYLSHRWAYSVTPPKEEWPVIEAKKIRFDEIADHFPADMPLLSTEQRRKQIAIRQQHVRARYRVF